MPYATVGAPTFLDLSKRNIQVFDCGLLTLMLDLQTDIHSKPSMNSSWSWIIIYYTIKAKHSTLNIWLYFISYFFFFLHVVICLWKTEARAEAYTNIFRLIQSIKNIKKIAFAFYRQYEHKKLYILLLSSPITICVFVIVQCMNNITV